MQTVKLRRVGGSVMLAIPPNILEVLALREQSTVGLSVGDGRLTVTPSPTRRYTLDELMDRCDLDAAAPEEERDWTAAGSVGREVI